ncbi:hypothetical protein CaCOL14_007012 [Colletotrichum acutatum]
MSSSKDHFSSKSTHNRDKGMLKRQQKSSIVTKRSSRQPTWRGRGSSGSGIAPFQARPPSTSGRRLQRAQQGLKEKWFDGVRVTELGALRPDPAAALAMVVRWWPLVGWQLFLREMMRTGRVQMGEALVTLSKVLTLGHDHFPLMSYIVISTTVARLKTLDRRVCLELFYDGIEALTKRSPMK